MKPPFQHTRFSLINTESKFFHILGGNTAEYFALGKVVGVAWFGAATLVESTAIGENSGPMTVEAEAVGCVSVDSQHTGVATQVAAATREKTVFVVKQNAFAETELEERVAVRKNETQTFLEPHTDRVVGLAMYMLSVPVAVAAEAEDSS